MKKTLLLTATALFFCLSAANAQSADKITEMLNAKQATYGQAAYIAAVYTGAVPETADEAESIKALESSGIINKSVLPSDTIRLGEASFIFAKASNMKGGLWYTIHPCARYAFRQMQADGLLPASSDPYTKISGADALNLFNSCMTNYTKDTQEAGK